MLGYLGFMSQVDCENRLPKQKFNIYQAYNLPETLFQRARWQETTDNKELAYLPLIDD